MTYQVLFSLKNNDTVFINVVCCSHDWRFKGLNIVMIFYNGVIVVVKSSYVLSSSELNQMQVSQ